MVFVDVKHQQKKKEKGRTHIHTHTRTHARTHAHAHTEPVGFNAVPLQNVPGFVLDVFATSVVKVIRSLKRVGLLNVSRRN